MSAALQRLMPAAPPAPGQPNTFIGLLVFVGIGASASALFVVLSTALIWAGTGIADWVVNAGVYAAMIVPVYLLHRRYSFASDASHWQALPRYMTVQACALLLAALFSFVVRDRFAVPTVPASILVIGLVSGCNYVVLRSWAFARAQWAGVVPA